MLDLTDEEREFLRAMRAVTLDQDGREIFVGLTADESEAYLPLSRRNESGEDLSGNARFMALHAKHEAQRQRVVDGEAPLDAVPKDD